MTSKKIGDLQACRESLEAEIKTLILDFELQTGLQVDSVWVNTWNSRGVAPLGRDADVRVTSSLPREPVLNWRKGEKR